MARPIGSLRDKKCFVTGAASGIGRATARALAGEGAQLFLTDLNAAQLDDCVRELRGAGGKVIAFRALDITDFEAVRGFARDLHARHGSMDVLLNIAGISTWGSVEAMEPHHYRKLIDVNLMGPIHVIHAFVPEMIRAGRGGHLVNVASAAALFGLPWHAGYSASKFGLRGLSEVLRFDLARHGIGVSLVCPGAVNTPLVQTVQVLGVDASHEEMQKHRAAFQRHAVTPDQAAAAIVRGLKRNQKLIFTSPDIRVGYWFQRKFSLPYELAMKLLNDRFHRVMERARKPSAGASLPTSVPNGSAS